MVLLNPTHYSRNNEVDKAETIVPDHFCQVVMREDQIAVRWLIMETAMIAEMKKRISK